MILHFSGRFLLTASLRRRRWSFYFYLLIVPVPVNHIREFREPFEATLDWYNPLAREREDRRIGVGLSAETEGKASRLTVGLIQLQCVPSALPRGQGGIGVRVIADY